MKFAVFFGLMSVFIGYWVYISWSSVSLILIYPLVSCILFTVAYLFNLPNLVAGKKEGRLNYFLALLNLPWLLVTWSVFCFQVMISREDKMNNIEGTNIWIGRYPFFSPGLGDFDVIIDLTSEFPGSMVNGVMYFNFPNLDGIQLKNLGSNYMPLPSDRVLIHCAQGHGRSATFASLLLFRLGLSSSPEDGLKMIQTARPGAVPSGKQAGQLENC